MKKLILLLGFILSNTYAHSEIPTAFTVVASQPPGGTIEVSCRKVFEIYNRIYSANAMILNKVGGGGAVAQREVVSSKKFTVGCSASPEHWSNLYPMPDLDNIKVVTQVAVLPDFYYTGLGNKSQSFAELISSAKKDNKTITIGGYTGHISRMEYVLRSNGIKYTTVPYQKTSDMVPSLIDGTLDIGIDGGTIMPLAKDHKIKLIGYYSPRTLTTHPEVKNYVNRHPELAVWLGTSILYLPKSVPSEQFHEFAQRVIKIIRSDEFTEWTNSRDLTALGENPKRAEEDIDKARQSYQNFRK